MHHYYISDRWSGTSIVEGGKSSYFLIKNPFFVRFSETHWRQSRHYLGLDQKKILAFPILIKCIQKVEWFMQSSWSEKLRFGICTETTFLDSSIKFYNLVATDFDSMYFEVRVSFCWKCKTRAFGCAAVSTILHCAHFLKIHHINFEFLKQSESRRCLLCCQCVSESPNKWWFIQLENNIIFLLQLFMFPIM